MFLSKAEDSTPVGVTTSSNFVHDVKWDDNVLINSRLIVVRRCVLIGVWFFRFGKSGFKLFAKFKNKNK